MIIRKYLRFLINFIASKKLSVKILYKGKAFKNSYKAYRNMLRALRFCLEFRH